MRRREIAKRLTGNSLQHSTVKIVMSDNWGLGFFVAIDTILTCRHILEIPENSVELVIPHRDKTNLAIFKLKGVTKDLIEVRQGIQNYQVLDVYFSNKTDIAIIQVEIDEDSEKSCVVLDTEDRLSDLKGDFHIYSYLENDTNPTTLKIYHQKMEGKSISFVIDSIRGRVSGSPLLNSITGKVCGIVSLHSPSHSPKETAIKTTTGYAVSVAEIYDFFSAFKYKKGSSFETISRIKDINQNFHHSLSNLPVRDYDSFIGRELQIKQLLEYISPDYRQHIIVVSGIAGIGKTALVLKSAYRCLQAMQSTHNNKNINVPIFDAIIFVSFNNNSKFLRNFASLKNQVTAVNLLQVTLSIAKTLDKSEKESVPLKIYKTEKITQIYEVLAKQRTLLIIDGIEDTTSDEYTDILAFLNNLPISTKAIVTTRENSLFYSHISLQPLSNRESEKFIERQAQAKDIAIAQNEIQKITNCLKGLPLALMYAVGQYALTRSVDTIRSIDPNLTEIDIGKICFESTLKLIKGTPAYDLLMCLSFFYTSASRDALIKIAGYVYKDRQASDDALEKLKILSLITEDIREGEERYTTLPITREYIISELETVLEVKPSFEKEARKKWIDWYRDFLYKNCIKDPEANQHCKANVYGELENIGEVLFWCANYKEYDAIKEFWEYLDPYIEYKEYWAIRLYWWNYLEEESQKRGDLLTYIKSQEKKNNTLDRMGLESSIGKREYSLENKELRKYAARATQRQLKHN